MGRAGGPHYFATRKGMPLVVSPLFETGKMGKGKHLSSALLFSKVSNFGTLSHEIRKLPSFLEANPKARPIDQSKFRPLFGRHPPKSQNPNRNPAATNGRLQRATGRMSRVAVARSLDLSSAPASRLSPRSGPASPGR